MSGTGRIRAAFCLSMSALLSLWGPSAGAREAKLTFLHVNDSHGVGVTPDDANDCALARVATVIGRVRAEEGIDRVFVTVGGDIGVHPHDGDYLTNQTDALAEVLAFNLLGVDFVTPGNHEFDNRCDWTEKLMAASEFPWVSANVYHKGTTRHFATGGGHVVREAAGARVAVFGLSPGPAGKSNVLKGGDRIGARDEIEVGREIVPRLRALADVVVGVTHIGLDQDRKLAEATDVDLILGGTRTPGRPASTCAGRGSSRPGGTTSSWRARTSRRRSREACGR
ncbi:MAG: metallophosphoesterase [Planctomycetota bacterium]|jgi:2',3'-cyclic-nucleotide 2'-phosphodiesterase (5'-nucleotidase family)